MMIQSTTSYRTGTILLNVVVAVIGIIILMPIVWMVSASFKPLSEIYAFRRR
jgi:ABC-type glycerol-3-phosphate transport system permease component